MDKGWKVALIVLASLAVGYMLAGGGILQRVHGASEGRTSGVICVIGTAVNQDAPIVLVDVPNETILIYEYSYRNNEIELTSARTYRFDKLLKEYQIKGESVEAVRQFVTQ